MKKIIIAAILIGVSFTSFAQENTKDGDEGGGGFKKENFFTGGGLDLSLSNYGTVLGAEPQFGYSITKWLDAGVVLNFIYSAGKEYDPITGYYTGYKWRETDLGPGAFVRIYPINYIFIQGQYEKNHITYKDYYNDALYSTTKLSVPSLLLGGGYCSGRQGVGGDPFFYLSISVDVLGHLYSPYLGSDGAGNTYILPIVRGGIQVPLFQNSTHKKHHREDY